MTREEVIEKIEEDASECGMIGEIDIKEGMLRALRYVEKIDEPKWQTDHSNKLEKGTYILQWDDGRLSLAEVQEWMERYDVSPFVVAWQKIEPYKENK